MTGPSAHGDAPAAQPGGPRLILASASPRRQELLRQAGYAFAVCPANVDEEAYPPGMLPNDIARFLSIAKARAVGQQYPADLILAADTVVAFGDRPLGKPADREEARRMLQLLSGTTHIVITGVSVYCQHTDFLMTRTVMSAVRMRRLTPQEVEAYVNSRQWEGKAGGYGIQDQDPFVTNMAGSLTNIVGLPMEAATQMLASVGIAPERPGA